MTMSRERHVARSALPLLVEEELGELMHPDLAEATLRPPRHRQPDRAARWRAPTPSRRTCSCAALTAMKSA